jgi:hypothetical protein
MKSVELTGGASRPRATSASSRANSAAAAPPCPLSSSLFSAAWRRREALPGPTSGAPPQSRPPPSSCLWPPPSARAHRTTTVGSLLLPILGGHEKLADGRRVKGGDADMCVCGLCSLKQRNFGRATCGGCRCAKDDGRERGGIIEGLQQLASFASFAESPLSLALSCRRPESPSQPLFRGGGGSS